MIDPLGGPAYWWPFIAGFVIAYLIGSVPFGLLLTRLGGAGDVRAIGSGNIGATNVLRTGRKGLALATLALDMLKGALPVWLAYRYLGPDMAVIVGLGTVVGHCFPIWLKFQGGKGVATAGGVVIALTPAVAHRNRGVSAGGPCDPLRLARLDPRRDAAAPGAYLMGYAQAAELYLLLALIIVLKHAGNIRRLTQEATIAARPAPLARFGLNGRFAL